MAAKITTDNDYISRLNGSWANRPSNVRFNYANARSVHENSVALAFVDDLRISRDQLHVCLRCRLLHRRHDGTQHCHLQSFLQDESGAEIEWTGTAHGKIVHGPIDR